MFIKEGKINGTFSFARNQKAKKGKDEDFLRFFVKKEKPRTIRGSIIKAPIWKNQHEKNKGMTWEKKGKPGTKAVN